MARSKGKGGGSPEDMLEALLEWLWFSKREKCGGAEVNPPKLNYGEQSKEVNDDGA